MKIDTKTEVMTLEGVDVRAIDRVRSMASIAGKHYVESKTAAPLLKALDAFEAEYKVPEKPKNAKADPEKNPVYDGKDNPPTDQDKEKK